MILNSKFCFTLIPVCLAGALLCGGVVAQGNFPLQEGVIEGEQNKFDASIGIIRLDSIFTESKLGNRIETEFTNSQEMLKVQNQYFDCVFEKEEERLAARKPSLDEGEFISLRSQFTDRVNERRQIQDNKESLLEQWRNSEVRRLEQSILELADTVARNLRLGLIISNVQTIWSNSELEISREFIPLLDSNYGDGTEGNEYISADAFANLKLQSSDPLEPECSIENIQR